jgi:hypothetical protein
MATVIGIFENQYLNKKPLTVVKPGTKQEDLLIFLIQYKFAMKPLKQINVDTIVSVIKILIQFYRLQKCLNLKLYY